MVDTVRSSRAFCLVIRLAVAAIGVGAWFGTQALIGQRPVASSGIVDGLHLLTAPMTSSFPRIRPYSTKVLGEATRLGRLYSGFLL